MQALTTVPQRRLVSNRLFRGGLPIRRHRAYLPAYLPGWAALTYAGQPAGRIPAAPYAGPVEDRKMS
jgi:hypothetical protein